MIPNMVTDRIVGSVTIVAIISAAIRISRPNNIDLPNDCRSSKYVFFFFFITEIKKIINEYTAPKKIVATPIPSTILDI